MGHFIWGSSSGVEYWTSSSFSLLEGVSGFAQPAHMRFVDVEKTFNYDPKDIL